jgi:hypothetical protein
VRQAYEGFGEKLGAARMPQAFCGSIRYVIVRLSRKNDGETVSTKLIRPINFSSY